jgi:hypothetical protein
MTYFPFHVCELLFMKYYLQQLSVQLQWAYPDSKQSWTFCQVTNHSKKRVNNEK